MSRILYLLLLISSISNAQIYKWVDEGGDVHFSDTPRQGAKVIVVKARKPATMDTESSAEEVNRRIKSTSNRLSEKRKKEELARYKERQRIDKKNKNDQKKCQSLRNKISQNKFRWDLTKRQGFKQSQKDAYLIKKEKYQSEFNRYCT